MEEIASVSQVLDCCCFWIIKQEETHETIKKYVTDEIETEKKTETDEIGTKLDESSSGTKDENTENDINLDGLASNQSSEKIGRSKESFGDLPMSVTPSLASETEASHGDNVVSGKLVHQKLPVVYQLIQHTSCASCLPSVSPKASFSRFKYHSAVKRSKN
ncbi:uncharacterized protein [Euphorbia lathyris]|uniref:uncharacterized protein isoform X2 n=1 Tax=Euphorbia lathyris TaxID=212925 RepID=UPI0033143A22